MKQLISAQTRYRALPIIMEGIAAERGYRIEVSDGLSFSINRKDKVIRVPNLKSVGSDEDAICLEGGLDHELMHVDQTDPEFRVEDPILHKLWNIIEDPRGEIGFFKKYPGAARNIGLTLEVLRAKGRYAVPSADKPFSVLCGFLLYELRAGVLGQTSFCNDLRAPTAALARTLFGPIADQCLSVAREVVEHERGRQGSYKALDAARRILELLDAALPETPKQDGKSDPGADQGKPEEGQGQHGAPKQPDASSDRGDGAGEKAGSGASPEGRQGGGGAGGKAASGKDVAKTSPAVTHAHREAIRKAIEQGRSDDKCPYSKGLEEHISGNEALDLHAPNPAKSEMGAPLLDHRTAVEGSSATRLRNLSVSNKVTLALSLRIGDMLEGFGKTDTRYARSGRFDPDRMVRALCGNRRTYRRTSVSETINTSVCVLVDNSGSMSKPLKVGESEIQIMDLANAATIGMGCVLEQFDIPFAVISFSTYSKLQHDFDDAWQKTLARYNVVAEDTTEMGKAYYHAVCKLMHRDEDRRIILMVTDGAPTNWQQLESSVKEAKRFGIETRTVLIQPNGTSMARFKELETVPAAAWKAAEIPKAIFATLESSLSN